MKMQPGRELDALVAVEVMGHKNISWEEESRDGIGPSFSTFEPHYNNFGYKVSVPKYSTSIADAWEVVEKLGTHNGWRMCGCGGGRYRVTFRDMIYSGGPSGWSDDVYDPDVSVFVYEEIGDSAPHAICLAALEAVRKS